MISHYKILEKLGQGGMGVVYKAHDLKLDRDVALKFLPTNLAASEEEITRFEREARAISALNHPNIETIYDVDETDGQKYLVLEYIPGGTLKSKLKQLESEDKCITIDKAWDYGIQIAEALNYAHQHQIIHRDVKSDNILLTESGGVKLTDFGLAKLRGTVAKTRTGSTLGTVSYMSPEQVRGEEVDGRTDIFSFGVVLYELFTSRLPFSGEYESAIQYAILNENPPPIKLLRPEIPQELETIVERCLRKDRSKRYQQMDEICSQLKSVRQQGPEQNSLFRKPKLWRWIAALLAAILSMICLYLFWPRPDAPPANSKSIAVLPFKNLSDSKEDEYFSDGVTEDILTQLSKISDLTVISRTTIMQYKNTQKALKTIGEELHVGVILEGSVRHSGNRIRISSQLIDAKADKHLWAETYDREMKDVFAIQSEVAKQIAAALRAKLMPTEKERIERQQTESLEAYQFYLKGRFYWNKRRLDDLQMAIDYFNQAISKDSKYARAYAGLASSLVLLPQYGCAIKEAEQWYTQAWEAASKALQMDSTIAEAHTVLGEIAQDHHYDWSNAERHFREAIRLDPSYPTTHHWYSGTLCYLGRIEEAITEGRRALELDPLSLIINTNLGDLYYSNRQYDKAMQQYRNALDLDAAFPWAHVSIGAIFELQGRYPAAIEEYEKGKKYGGDGPFTQCYLACAYVKAGRQAEAQQVLDNLLQMARSGQAVAYAIAYIYYTMGDKDKAFEWFERSFQNREIWLVQAKVDPLWDILRLEPRCTALLKKMGL